MPKGEGLDDFLVEIGRIVLSRAGRDKNRYFMICDIKDKEFVYISDGDYRKLQRPKLKKLKHLHKTPIILENIQEKLQNGKKVFDAELRSAIINAGYKSSENERRV
jgi:ribosomal protein L14E/L6E/L27E